MSIGTLAGGISEASAKPPAATPSTTVIASGVIEGANGTTIGPDGALYATMSDTGEILRIDRDDGETSVYATGLPPRVADIGGPMDIVFHGGTAYVLVSLFGTDDPTGIYRMDGPGDWTVIADLGAWAEANPPAPEIDIFIPTGVHYSLENYRGDLVVTDAHHNKVLRVGLDGTIEELVALGNVVPTGLETWGNQLLFTLAGPVPHLPENGRIMSLTRGRLDQIASGGPLLIDVERGRGATLFGLAQGIFTEGNPEGSPADPNTGLLLRADGDGGFVTVAEELDRPTSMEIVGNDAYVVGVSGDVLRVDDIAGPPFGSR
jgi:sugar lactone lactonase YvrE